MKLILVHSKGFSDLHSISYEEILSGNGFGLDEVRAGIKILSDIKSSTVIEHDKDAHYLLKKYEILCT